MKTTEVYLNIKEIGFLLTKADETLKTYNAAGYMDSPFLEQLCNKLKHAFFQCVRHDDE